MKRSGFDINEIKNGFCIAVTITASVLWLGACGNTNVSSQQPVQPTQTTEETVEPTVDPVEVDPVEPVEETFTVSAQDVIDLVTNQVNEHPQIPIPEMLSVVFEMNYDFMTEEERDIVMNVYGVSYEDLVNYYNEYLGHRYEVVKKSRSYYSGYEDSIDPELDINNWVTYEEICLNPEYKDICREFDIFTIERLTKDVDFIEVEGNSSVEIAVNNATWYRYDNSSMLENVFEQQVNQSE